VTPGVPEAAASDGEAATPDLPAVASRISGLAVNCSILYGARPVPDALADVQRSGLGAVEFWWPFASAQPSVREVEEFVAAVTESGLELVALNLFAGDMGAGDRGVLSWPGFEQEFRASVEVARRIQAATGCSVFNALYGQRRDGFGDDRQRETAIANLEHACDVLAPEGGTVVLEPLSGFADYPLTVAAEVMDVVDLARQFSPNVGMLLDVYHLWANGDDVARAIDRYAPGIAHVQLADGPGRGVPGSGRLPLLEWVERLRTAGYAGRFALEFVSNEEDPLRSLRQGGAV